MSESVSVNLDRLFSMADNSNMCKIIVNYKNGYKEYKVCDGSGVVYLNGDLEEDIFLLFKYPEVYVEEISKYLDSDKTLLNEYFNNPEIVRHQLRIKFRDLLFKKAEEIIHERVSGKVSKAESEKSSEVKVVKVQHISSKPIHKSKTVVVNSGLIATGLGLIVNGIMHKDLNSIEKGLTILVPAVVNFILRLVTKCPIQL